MFTGIVEDRRQVVRADRSAGGLALGLDLGPLAEGVAVGDSIAVSGCCLTVEHLAEGVATFHLMDETLGLTTFGGVAVGDERNVERSLRVGDRLGGHFVSGHIDGVGDVAAVDLLNEGQTDISITLPGELSELVIPKGSIAIDGVSLTISGVGEGRAKVSLIPHTLAVTTLGSLVVGDRVHLEMDMIGKWVLRLVDHLRPQAT